MLGEIDSQHDIVPNRSFEPGTLNHCIEFNGIFDGADAVDIAQMNILHGTCNFYAQSRSLVIFYRGCAVYSWPFRQRKQGLHFVLLARLALLALDPVFECLQALHHAWVFCAGSAHCLQNVEYLHCCVVHFNKMS